MEEALLGFDMRLAENFTKQNWDEARRKMFLLKEDVDTIYSIDRRIWDSVIDKLNLEAKLPANYGLRYKLWSDLNKLRDFATLHAIASQLDYVTIAVTQLFYESELEQNSLRLYPFNPPQIHPDWELLGYDIAEEPVNLSGLSNCGYTVEKKARGIKHFAHAINDYHLFNNSDVAQEFATWNQSRDPGHGPWYVTGLYRIPKTDE